MRFQEIWQRRQAGSAAPLPTPLASDRQFNVEHDTDDLEH
jgi:hypothetical protein